MPSGLSLFMRTQPVFDSWDCTPPILPPRSRLYSLAPIGVGTPFVESLSGYVARLADAHAVSVSNLVGRELSALVSNPLVQPLESHWFHPRFYAMNGLGEPARKWVEALQLGTMKRDLRSRAKITWTFRPEAGYGSSTRHGIPPSPGGLVPTGRRSLGFQWDTW